METSLISQHLLIAAARDLMGEDTDIPDPWWKSEYLRGQVELIASVVPPQHDDDDWDERKEDIAEAILKPLRPTPKPEVKPGGIFLVYEDENGERFTQSIFNLQEAGTLIDPETGDDLTIIGWTDAE